jgi:hypothetical protein
MTSGEALKQFLDGYNIHPQRLPVMTEHNWEGWHFAAQQKGTKHDDEKETPGPSLPPLRNPAT